MFDKLKKSVAKIYEEGRWKKTSHELGAELVEMQIELRKERDKNVLLEMELQEMANKYDPDDSVVIPRMKHGHG